MINNTHNLSSVSPKFGNAAAASETSYPIGKTMKAIANASDKALGFHNSVASAEKLEASSPLMKRLRKVVSMVTDYDFREVHPVNLFKKIKFSIVEPPIGALMLLLYPFTIGPRLKRAKERDPSGIEFMDIIRRDMTAITMFLFLLKPLTNAINTLKQKHDGLKLVKHDNRPVKSGGDLIGKIFSYTQFDDFYKLTSPNQLEAIVVEGNGQGLKKAVDKYTKQYLDVLGKYPDSKPATDTAKALTEFRGKITELVEHQAKITQNSAGQKLSDPEVANKAKQAFEQMQKARGHFEKVNLSLLKTGGNPLTNQFAKLKKSLPAFEDMMCKFAKSKRLPVDMLAFGIAIGAIGWFPVWFNDLLSKKRQTEGAAKKRSVEAGNTDPQKIWAALQLARAQAYNQPNPMQQQ